MKTVLVTIIIMLDQNWSGYFVKERYIETSITTMEECLAMKRQREFLPPPYAQSAEVYFCVEVPE